MAIQDSARTPDHRSPAIDLRGLRVLLVDDDEDLLQLLQYVLREAHAEVWTATTVEDAMELFRLRPDVIVSDIGLPDRDGYQLLRMVRTYSPLRGGAVPAIALTARAQPVDETLAYLAGYQAYFAKPIRGIELVAAIHRLVARR